MERQFDEMTTPCNVSELEIKAAKNYFSSRLEYLDWLHSKFPMLMSLKIELGRHPSVS